LFHNANLFGSCIIHILYTGCAKIKKKNNSGAKGLINTNIKPLNAELNPISCLLALLGTHHILHVSRIRVKGTSPTRFGTSAPSCGRTKCEVVNKFCSLSVNHFEDDTPVPNHVADAHLKLLINILYLVGVINGVSFWQ
jgi:hypothetical protein